MRNGSFLDTALRFSNSEGLVILNEQAWNYPKAVSQDGSVIVGYFREQGIPPYGKAFRWSVDNPQLQDLDDLGGDGGSRALDVSDDGSVVVGTASSSNLHLQAFRWTQADGMVGLGYLPNTYRESIAQGVSDDGEAIVGLSKSYSASGDYEAFLWTEQTGIVALGDLPGGSFRSEANDVIRLEDGRILVVGKSATGADQWGSPIYSAFIWDSQDGSMRSLQEWLQTNFQLDLSGWALMSAMKTALSEDGSVIAISGQGNHNGQIVGFVVRINRSINAGMPVAIPRKAPRQVV